MKKNLSKLKRGFQPAIAALFATAIGGFSLALNPGNLQATGVQNPAAEFLPDLIVDEFNPDVTDAMRGNMTPKHGGRLRIRTAADFQHFNNITVTGAPETQLINHMTDGLIDQNRENLEHHPDIAWFWREGDILKYPDSDPIIGRILDMTDDSVTYVPEAWKSTFAQYDVADYSVEEGWLELSEERGGERIHGEIRLMPTTISVDTAFAADADTRTVALADLDTYVFELGTIREERPFAKRNCAFEFFIRDGVRWHDGQPFTPQDVVFSIETIQNPFVDAQHRRAYYDDVELVEAIENNGVRFLYRQPYFQALNFVGGVIGSRYLIPRHVFRPETFGGDIEAFAEAFNRHSFRQNPVGTGPFRFKEWRSGDFMTMERNPNYWKNDLPQGAVPYWTVGAPYLNEVTHVHISEKTTVMIELRRGGLHVDFDVEPDTWVSREANETAFLNQFVRASRVGQLFTYIGWNQENVLFQDREVRRALAMMIPREEIAKEIHYGVAFPVNGPFYVNSPGYDRTVEPIEYNPAEARRILARAGWRDRTRNGILDKEIDGRTVDFAFTYSIHTARDYHQKIADIIKERMEEARVRVTIDRKDWRIFSTEVRDKNFDAVRFAWGAALDPDPFQIWHSSQIDNKGDNFVSFRNDRVDELCIRIREEFDAEKRWAMVREVHRIIHEEQPYAFLFGFNESYFIDRRLRGVKLFASMYPYNFSDWYFVDPQASGLARQ